MDVWDMWPHSNRIALVTLAFALFSTAAGATTYYVKNTGNDSLAGTSDATAWATLSKVNGFTFKAGDVIKFRGNESFAGGISISASQWGGSRTAPVTITSYNGGRATIASASAQSGFFAYDYGGIIIDGIDFSNSGGAANATGDGILLYTDGVPNIKHQLVSIRNSNITGYKTAISILGWNRSAGYNGVLIEDVEVFGNAGGISIQGETGFSDANSDVVIRRAYIHDNPGRVGQGTDTGYGIALGMVNGGTIEHSLIKNNGANGDSSNGAVGGSVGIMFWDSTRVTVQYNEVSWQKNSPTSNDVDANGFNLGGGCQQCVLQYNYSHNNEGAGYLIDGYALPARANANAVVRYNVSENDARGTATSAGIYLFNNAVGGIGQLRDFWVYNNTVYMSPGGKGSFTAACIILNDTLQPNNSGPITGGYFINNICHVSSPAVRMVNVKSNVTSTQFVKNVFYGSTLSVWNSASHTGDITADPLLLAPGDAGQISSVPPLSLASLIDYYGLQTGSPARNTGLPLLSTYSVNPGWHDLAGTPLPGALSVIGAFAGMP